MIDGLHVAALPDDICTCMMTHKIRLQSVYQATCKISCQIW